MVLQGQGRGLVAEEIETVPRHRVPRQGRRLGHDPLPPDGLTRIIDPAGDERDERWPARPASQDPPASDDPSARRVGVEKRRLVGVRSGESRMHLSRQAERAVEPRPIGELEEREHTETPETASRLPGVIEDQVVLHVTHESRQILRQAGVRVPPVVEDRVEAEIRPGDSGEEPGDAPIGRRGSLLGHASNVS